MSISFDLLATTGLGCVIVFFGKAIVAKVKPLRDWGIPAPVVGGLIVAIVLCILKLNDIVNVTWDSTLSKFFMNIFFTCVGFGFSKSLFIKGKKFAVGITLSVVLLVLLQGFLGMGLADLLGIHPLLGIQIGTGALAGGVGTTSAFGPVYESMGAIGATEIGVASATLGMILGSIIGGPLAVLLIKKHKLKPDPEDEKLKKDLDDSAAPLNTDSLLKTVCMMIFIAACGIPIWMLLSKIPMIEMPYFIGCLFAGAIARNVLEAFGVSFNQPEIETVEHITLDIFLAITVMTMDLTRIAGAMTAMLIILAIVTIATVLFAYFIAFRMYHSDYNGACMVAGFIGMGMGSGSNAVADERAVMDQYGYAHLAWVLYPAFSVLVVDIANPLFMSLVPGIFGFGG